MRELVMLGGAGNVARNVAALGGSVALVGLIGGDAEGKEALRLIETAEPVIEGYPVTDPSRPTTLKTRFVSANQQLLRVDLEESRPVTGELEQRVIRTLRDAGRGAGVILISDYGKGVVTDALIAAARECAAR
jgi:D-beta-D-heptose 7-phosphate kinase/D-beta-D-heptose 1-phosphate adenosyltransferase